MAEYSVKKLAEMFDCSKQSIFNDMDEMLKLGYARKDGIQYFINEGGFNYLSFIGNYDNKESIMSFNNKDEVFIRQYEKLVGTPVLYCPPEFCNAWIVNILGRNTKVENFDEGKYNLEDFKDIPSYPKDGYIKEIDGVFFVKTEPLN